MRWVVPIEMMILFLPCTYLDTPLFHVLFSKTSAHLARLFFLCILHFICSMGPCKFSLSSWSFLHFSNERISSLPNFFISHSVSRIKTRAAHFFLDISGELAIRLFGEKSLGWYAFLEQ